MTKKRRVTTTRAQISASRRRRALSEADAHVRVKREKRATACEDASPSCSGVSAEAVAHFQALQPSSSSPSSSSGASALAEVYEWLGDAVIGELVGRCLLSQFHRAPLSARVFRNLRLGVVTNRNLALVFEAMGYAGCRRRNAVVADLQQAWKPMKMKERADVVEAVVGELILRLHAQRKDKSLYAVAGALTGTEVAYRTHLDAVVASMLHAHFAARTRAAEQHAETAATAEGPLSVAFNPFACLPEELLDETTGELVVHDGVFDQELELEKEGAGDRSATDLIEEYKAGESKAEAGGEDQKGPHHCFQTSSSGDRSTDKSDVARVFAVELARKAMLELDENHVLRTSSEIFEVFKIYGMAVLAERVSLALALPHVPMSSEHRTTKSGEALMVTPARLTRQRQLALSMANLATCAVALGIAQSSSSCKEDSSAESEEEVATRRVLDERRRANTLRAFVGFHSTMATTSSGATTTHSNALVNAICRTLLDSGASSRGISTPTAPNESGSLRIPEREPLVALMQSVGEARMFMNSKTCDELHTSGERPVSAETRKRKQTQKSFLLRQCDSEQVEDLFETLAREQDHERRANEARAARQDQEKQSDKRRRKKKVHLPADTDTANLTANLERFLHRRFLFCLEEIVVLFAQRKTEECRSQITMFQHDLEPCANELQFRKWEVSTSTLTLAMRDSFYRLLLHDVCQFHAVVSSSRNTRDGTRITQLRLPLHYTWTKVARRITTEQQARC